MSKLTPEQILALSPDAQYWMSVTEAEKQRAHEASLAFITPRHHRRDVIRALGANVTMIQNWQTRQQVTLDADVVRDGQEWRLYSSRDVLLLGIAVRLSEVGFRASLLQGVLETVKPILHIGSPFLASNRPSFIVVLATGQVIGPEIGSSLDFADVPNGSFIVVRLDHLIREALEPLGLSITVGNAAEHKATVERLKSLRLDAEGSEQ